MMKGLKTRGGILCCLLLWSIGHAEPEAYITYTYMKVRSLNTRITITPSPVRITLYANEMAGLEFTGHYRNPNEDRDSKIWLSQRPGLKLPGFATGWRDQIEMLGAGDSTVLTNTVYLFPRDIGTYTFEVENAIRLGEKSTDLLQRHTYRFIVRVIQPPHDSPFIGEEPEFTHGLINTIDWTGADGARTQDVYYFDSAHPALLEQSIRGLYKPSQAGGLQTIVDGLLDGRRYGYFVKAVFDDPGGPIALCSDITYSTQDNTPPEDVHILQLVPRGNRLELSWKTVSDTVSGLRVYRIYRATDTQQEMLLDSLVVEPFGPAGDTLFWNDAIPGGPAVYYRVQAVDRVGNEGWGERSNAYAPPGGNIIPGGGDAPGWPEEPLPEGAFVKSSRDTLKAYVNPLENVVHVRFQAVRDSQSYFDNPPPTGFRLFDSGLLDPDTLDRDPRNTDYVLWAFDYLEAGGVRVDPNFVSGHTYYRRIILYYVTTSDTFGQGSIITDLFPPEDIRNLKIEATIDNPDDVFPAGGYSRWHFRISWEPARDVTSGFSRYDVLRLRDSMDPEPVRIASLQGMNATVFLDSIAPDSRPFTNPLVVYKILSEDVLGNKRQSSDWTVSERALCGPGLAFVEGTDPDQIPRLPDTLFTRKNAAFLKILHFDLAGVQQFRISVNGRESIRTSRGQDTLRIVLPGDEISRIKVRVLYQGGRSSVWSNLLTVVRASSEAPELIEVKNDSTYWKGNIALRWVRPQKSADLDFYEVWRDSARVAQVRSVADTVSWTDLYAIDERTGEPGEPLVAYADYDYAVRKVNVFGDESAFSETLRSYCNHPPTLIGHGNPAIEAGRYVFDVWWTRVRPTLVQSGFKTKVRVFRDDLNTRIHEAMVTDDDTAFTFLGAEIGHNYIFQVQEIPNGWDRRSAWSEYYTVSSLVQLDTFETQPQPLGDIFVYWNNPGQSEKFEVDSFLVFRDSTALGTFSSGHVSYMDPAAGLRHGRAYRYTVFAVDSLDHVVAAASRTDTCDTGAVFITQIEHDPMRYFNDDSVTVSWFWRDISGARLDGNSRGAATYLLQASVSSGFPADTSQTRSVGFDPVDPGRASRRIRVPHLNNRDNERVYFRIACRDRFGHPGVLLWSDDFYDRTFDSTYVIFDPVPPQPVRDLATVSSEAYYHGPDSIVVRLHWTGTGVEFAEAGSPLFWNPQLSNVARYQVVRRINGRDTLVGTRNVLPGLSTYDFSDIVYNRIHEWRIISVDSAGNQTAADRIALAGFIATPEPPAALHARGCRITPADSIPLDYRVEIAFNPEHFRLAYEIDGGSMSDRLICRSEWIDALEFSCSSGWGSIETDSSWFRVKARKMTNGSAWESGWSGFGIYPDGSRSEPGEKQIHSAGVPEQFELFGNYPNPFNHSTVISYNLPESGIVTIRIFNLLGGEVWEERAEQDAGRHQMVWEGRNRSGISLPSGIYIADIQAALTGEFHHRRLKMMMIQ